MENKLLITPAPHITKHFSTNALMYSIMIALLPTAISGVVVFGVKSLFIMLISIGCSYVFDVLFKFLKNKKWDLFEFSSVVTGLMIALIFPVTVPLYFPVIAAFIAIVLFKGLFGGVGKNIFNPAGTARVILGLIFSGLTLSMFQGIALEGEVSSPLYYFMVGDFSSITIRSLFFGTAPAAIGTASIFCILVTGIMLMVYKVIDWIIPVSAIASFVVISLFGYGAISIIPFLFTGSFLFVSMFMLTDPTSSPNTFWGKFFYGLIFGLVSGLFRVNFILGETSVFVALLVANLFAPLLDKIFTPIPIGIKREG